MTVKNFITKGMLPLVAFGIVTWLGQYIFIVNGSIDWVRFMLVYGVPIGIPHMFVIIPMKMDLSGTMGVVILGVIVGAVFGFVIAAYMAIRAVWYIVAFPISLLMRKGRDRI